MQNETAGQLKQRLRKALNLSEKEFGKYKLARIHRWEKIDYYADGASRRRGSRTATTGERSQPLARAGADEPPLQMRPR